MKKIKKKTLIIRGTVLVIILLFCYLQNNLLTVSRYRYHDDKIAGDLDGYTIVQISDLHNKMFGISQSRLLRKVEECDPDLIVITGDLVDSNRTNIDKAMAFVDGAVRIAPVYYVTGNHELLLEGGELAELMRRMQEAGVVCLDNDWTRISSGDASFCLIGLGDSSLMGNTLQKLQESAQEEPGVRVLLAHEPQYLERYSAQRADLVLSGHAHGGQFRLPIVGGVVAPDQGFFPRYSAGAYRDGQTVMIVSRGLGNSIIPLRLFNYPDIVCVRFSEE